jgi:hypothetical protein
MPREIPASVETSAIVSPCASRFSRKAAPRWRATAKPSPPAASSFAAASAGGAVRLLTMFPLEMLLTHNKK